MREGVEGDLAADAECEAVGGEFLLEDFDEGGAEASFLEGEGEGENEWMRERGRSEGIGKEGDVRGRIFRIRFVLGY